MRIYGDGTATRDFLYVGDLCQGIVAALDAKLPLFNVFHLSSGREVSVKELAEMARAAAGLEDYPIEYEPKRIRRSGEEFCGLCSGPRGSWFSTSHKSF